MPRRFEYVRVVHNVTSTGGRYVHEATGYFTDGSTTKYQGQEDALAKLGSNGWELVTVTVPTLMMSVLYLKRERG